MDKVVLINKPSGWTSFDVIARLRKLTGEKKMGHTGTLDVNATGLLIVLCGRYTKYLPYCQHDHKRYRASIHLGQDTISKDIWGDVVDSRSIHDFTMAQLRSAVSQCIGKQEQIPPMVSSKKINGRKLMDYAKHHQQVVVEPKPIIVYDATLVSTDPITVDFDVSGGTYVRNLCEDIAHRLDNCGAMASLVRTGIGKVSLDQAQSVDALDVTQSIDIDLVLDESIPRISIDDPTDIYHGKAIQLDCDASEVFIVFQRKILAVYERQSYKSYHCKRGLW